MLHRAAVGSASARTPHPEAPPGMSIPRLLAMKTPLGEEALLPVALTVDEAIGEPYTIEVEAVGKDATLTAKQLLGQPISVTITRASTYKRSFHGVVVEFARLGPGPAGTTAYRLVAAPKAWRAGLALDCAIFQDKTLRVIVDQVLNDEAQETPSWTGQLPSTQIPYCTRFNETGLGFVSRLLEEHGLTYYHRHAEAEATMVITGDAAALPLFVGSPVRARQASDMVEELAGWQRLQRPRVALVELSDMDAERVQPSRPIEKNSRYRALEAEPSAGMGKHARTWPGGMSTRPGMDYAKLLMERAEAESERFAASTTDPRFQPGLRLSVEVVEEGGGKASAQYAVLAVRHRATDTSRLTSGAGGPEDYGAQLTLVSSERPLRLPPRHPRPVMAGLHSAKVTGPANEKIHTDALGRIKVLFPWDHAGPKDDKSSIWVRVMQPAAGAWGGTWFLPRVGDEVLVAFLDADPDRPIVVGSAYGQDGKPPFDPGANKTQTGYSTRSYKSDAKADANVLRFEDKKDNEEVLLHAQKNLTVEVENDEKRTIDNARTTLIKKSHDTYTLEEGNRTETIKQGNDTYSLDTGNREHTIKQGNDTYTLSMGNRAEAIKSGNDSLKIDKGNLAVELGMGNESHAIKMGNVTIKCDLGSVTIEAMQKITLKVGANSIEVSQQGVTIKGIMVNVEGTAMTNVKAPMTSVKGDGMVQVQGGVVMIN